MKITITGGSNKDFGKLILLRCFLIEHEAILDRSVKVDLKKVKCAADYMKKCLKKKDHLYLLALDNDLPCGYLHASLNLKDRVKSSYLSELYVMDAYRGNGIGKKLVKAYWDYARRRGISISILETLRENNDETFNFYRKLKYLIVNAEGKMMRLEKII